MTQPRVSVAASSSDPWWSRTAFRFVAPGGEYDPQQYHQAVLGHRLIKDFAALLRHRMREASPNDSQAHIDEQGQWFPLQATLWALDIETSPAGLFPLPQPRPEGSETPNPWLITLDEAWLSDCKPPVFIPLGLILTRLSPISNRQIAQVVSCWLLYQVLPVCAQSQGPATWEALDTMLSPVT